MALSTNIKFRTITRNAKRNLVDLTIGVAGDYPAGGITLASIQAAGCGVSTVNFVEPIGSSVAVAWQYNPGTDKLQAFKTGAGLSGVLVEAAGADVAAAVVRLEVIGDAVNAV